MVTWQVKNMFEELRDIGKTLFTLGLSSQICKVRVLD